MAKTAIVGGAGRLGRYIVDELRHIRDLVVLDRNVSAATAHAQTADITVLDDLRRGFSGVDELIHVAGIDGHVQTPQEVFFETNVMGSWNVLQAAVEHSYTESDCHVEHLGDRFQCRAAFPECQITSRSTRSTRYFPSMRMV